MSTLADRVDIACPVCSKGQSRYLFSHGTSDLRLCRDCGVRFAHPMEHPGEAWYESSDIYEEVRWNLPNVSSLGTRWEFAGALNYIGKNKKSVFDVGCGRGDFLMLAKSMGHDVAGIDLNETLIRVAEEAYGLHSVAKSTVEEFASRKTAERFDVVTAFEVLEHLPRPRQFIEQCLGLLKPEGKLILSVPGFDRLPFWVGNAVDMPPHHLILWTETGLRKLLTDGGLHNIQVERKPLLLGDIMYHAVRLLPGLQKPGFVAKGARGLLKIILLPVWLLLRWRPRSGGFTYLAAGSK